MTEAPANHNLVFEFNHNGKRNEKQIIFYDTVMLSVGLQLPYRHFYYGGAIRGGKTFVCLYILVTLARLFPNSRWHVIREDNPALESTTIPSMEKLIGLTGDDFVWKRSAGNRQVKFRNGSKIFFKSQNIQRDPELNDFLGLETNGVLLEQMEGLSEKLYNRVIERIGSWYIYPMPIPVMLGTFNPTRGWVKKLVYDRHIKNELKENEIFVEAVPDDNPFVTPEQWKNWQNLPEDAYNQMIKAQWVFLMDGNLFAYKFDPYKHVKPRSEIVIDRRLPLYAIFDFNVDPITCLMAQRESYTKGRIIAEERIRTSDIFELTERIKDTYGEYYLVATGDASGRNKTAITRGNRSYVNIIKAELSLSDLQVQFPKSNPSVRNTRMLMNAIFNKHSDFLISDACPFLIDDLLTVKTDENGEIDKKTDKLKTHLLDNLRYFEWNYFRPFLNI